MSKKINDIHSGHYSTCPFRGPTFIPDPLTKEKHLQFNSINGIHTRKKSNHKPHIRSSQLIDHTDVDTSTDTASYSHYTNISTSMLEHPHPSAGMSLDSIHTTYSP